MVVKRYSQMNVKEICMANIITHRKSNDTVTHITYI